MMMKRISVTTILLATAVNVQIQINAFQTTTNAKINSYARSAATAGELKAVYDPQENWSNTNANNVNSSKTYVLKQKQKAEQSRSEKKKSITAGGTSDKDTTTVRLFKKADSIMDKNMSKPGTGSRTIALDDEDDNVNGGGVQSLTSFFNPSSKKKNANLKEQPNSDFVNTYNSGVRTPISYIKTPNSVNNKTTSLSSTPNTLLDRVASPIEKLNSAAMENVETVTNDVTGFTTTIINSIAKPLPTKTFVEELEEVDEYEVMDVNSKFSMGQRIESVKAGIVGLITGGLALAPFAAIHDVMMPDDSIVNGPAQWEFDTDTGALAAALFAIVYRYCVRDGEQRNEMLQLGVIGAFVVVRTAARIRVPIYCSEAPLDCGEPFGYFDYDMIQQAIGSGLESIVMFGAAALAIEYCSDRKIIKRFR